MVIELTGLPGAGKTALAEAMKTRGAVLVPLPPRGRLLADAFFFWMVRPFLAARLLFCIVRKAPRGVRYEIFMNGYLGYAARYHAAYRHSRQGMVVVLDQGFFQLIISLHGVPPLVVKGFPKPDVLAVVETDAVERERRMVARGWAPRESFGVTHRLSWQRDAETAFHAAILSDEHSVRIYRHDGMQPPQEGAKALMEFATAKVEVSAHASPARNLLKIGIAVVSFAISRVVRIFSQSPEVVVLMYHAVDRSGWKLSVAPKALEWQMRHLARKGWAVPLADVVSYVKEEKKLPAHAIAVTFDDGYRDLLTTVLPILEQYHIPATVFIPSDFSAHTGPSGTARLTEEEARALAQSPLITIGSHAETHRKFTELAPEEMKKESENSVKELASILGKRPHFFAYPFGARSANAERAVRDAGYAAAFGITEGLVRKGDNLFCLKRVQVDGTMSFLLFRLRLTAALDWNRRIVDLFRRLT